MTEAVQIELIRSGTPILMTAVTAFLAFMVKRAGERSKRAEEASHQNASAIMETKKSIDGLEKNTNSITAAIVKLTGEKEHARGVEEEKLRGEKQAQAIRDAQAQADSRGHIPPAVKRQEDDQ